MSKIVDFQGKSPIRVTFMLNDESVEEVSVLKYLGCNTNSIQFFIFTNTICYKSRSRDSGIMEWLYPN
jgi:hypothetical protein